MWKALCIPAAKMAGDDSLRQKQEELKRKLQSSQYNNNSNPDKKKGKMETIVFGYCRIDCRCVPYGPY